MTTSTPTELARAVDEAVRSAPGVGRLFAQGARSALPPDADAPLSVVSRRMDSVEARISIEAHGIPAESAAANAAAAAASVLPAGARVVVRVSRVG